jgi:hypothetical protein
MNPSLKEQVRISIEARDLRRINRAQKPLNTEAADVLAYQVPETIDRGLA